MEWLISGGCWSTWCMINPHNPIFRTAIWTAPGVKVISVLWRSIFFLFFKTPVFHFLPNVLFSLFAVMKHPKPETVRWLKASGSSSSLCRAAPIKRSAAAPLSSLVFLQLLCWADHWKWGLSSWWLLAPGGIRGLHLFVVQQRAAGTLSLTKTLLYLIHAGAFQCHLPAQPSASSCISAVCDGVLRFRACIHHFLM